ncbi:MULTISPECIES: transcriptional repressor [Halocynthiibacter]|uniref:Transcriptional repressor n=1 Tax=Halocynthiibacter halioticoli TaxID=2986804 RepID=A0AAE3LQE6_9RHOB|nr:MULTISPECIES: transcriptional repressor [Halocynthiibacter]MCV6823423.1 transcriptional repressor [Halocynthiibacter halioticoli]MCW4056424.1 transcriptional repressor [Halocynthiibacter sp. SDUM655004]MDE0590610.1 transcriptional repressor [Halocynthiibacter sp. C4]
MAHIGFETHDHKTCIRKGVAEVDALCKDRKLQFTPVRKRVLEILLTEHRAVGAYEILDTLRKEDMGSQPPVAYRALDFLVSNGFAHKIERLNAFAACMHPGENHSPAFLICRTCDSVAETQCEPILIDAAAETGFIVERTVVEALGTCPKCNNEASA